QRFLKVDEKFESLRVEMNQRFEEVNQRFLKVDEKFESLIQEMKDMKGSIATIGGKLDLLVDRIVDIKFIAQLAVRVDELEKKVASLIRSG
ncbi:MAG: hypothetical protein ACK4G3_03115, partial [bacterium]